MISNRIYVMHDIDRWWHTLVSVELGGSVVTACRGRWPQDEPIRIADRPEPGRECGGCELVIAESARELELKLTVEAYAAGDGGEHVLEGISRAGDL